MILYIDTHKEIELGPVVGVGDWRVVFGVVGDPSLAAKLARPGGESHNLREWVRWETAGCDRGQWLAPAVELLGNGGLLLMGRGEPVCECDVPPRRTFPDYLRDITDMCRPENWTRIDGHVVACDYGDP